MIDAFQQNQDIHCLTASLLIGKDIDKVTKEERQAAKAVNFGLLYAMGARGLKLYAQNSYGVEMTDQQAVNFRKRFFEIYQGIASWQKNSVIVVLKKFEPLMDDYDYGRNDPESLNSLILQSKERLPI